MTGNLWLKVDVDQKDIEKLDIAIAVCREVLGTFEEVGYTGTQETHEEYLKKAIDTLEMVRNGKLF